MNVGSVEGIGFSIEQVLEFSFVWRALPEEDLRDGAIFEVVSEIGGGSSDLEDVVFIVV